MTQVTNKTIQKLYRFQIDQSGRVEELNRPTAIAIANEEQTYTSRLSTRLWEYHRKKGKTKSFGPKIFDAAVLITTAYSQFRIHELIIDLEYPGYDKTTIKALQQAFPETEVYIQSIGKKSPAHYAAYGVFLQKKEPDLHISARRLLAIINDPRTVTLRDKSQQIRSPRGPSSNYFSK